MVAKATISLNAQPFQQGANLVTQSSRKIDAALASSAKSNLGLSNAYNQVDSSIKKSNGSLTALGNQYKQLEASQAKLGKGLSTQNTLMGGLGKTADTTGSKLSKMGGFMKNNLTNASLLAGGIAGLDDQFHRLTKAQVGYERASFMADKVQQRIAKTQEALNTMRQKGLEGTTEYALKEKDLALAQEQLGITQERAEVAQTTLNEATEDFYIGILPNLIFVGGSAMSMITDLGLNTTKLKGAFTGIKGAVLGFAGSLGSIGTAASKINFGALASSFMGIAAPVLAGVAAIWLLVGAYQGLTNVSESIIEANNLQIQNLNALQIAHLKIRQALRLPITEQEEKDIAFFDQLTPEKLDEMKRKAEQAGKDLPKEFAKGFTTLPKEVKDVLKQVGDEITNAVAPVGKQSGEAFAEDFSIGVQAAAAGGTTVEDIIGNAFKATGKAIHDSDVFAQAFFNTLRKLNIPIGEGVKLIGAYTQGLTDNNIDAETVRQTEERLIAVYKERNKQLDITIDKSVQAGIQQRAELATRKADVDLYNQLIDKQGKHGILKTKEGKIYKDGVDITKDYNREQLIEANLRDNIRNIMVTQNEELVQQAKNLGMGTEQLKKYTANTQQSKEQITALNEDLAVNIFDLQRQANDLELGANAMTNYHLAHAKGAASAGEFLKQLAFGRSEIEAWINEVDRHIPGVTRLAEQYDLTKEQIEGLLLSWSRGEDAIREFNKEFKTFAAEWEKADMAKGFFKIEAKPEEILEDLFKNMPKGVRGRIKADLKLEQKQDDLKVALREFERSFVSAAEKERWEFDANLVPKKGKGKNDWIEYAKTIIEEIDDLPGKSEDSAFGNIKEKLQAAIKKGGDEGKQEVEDIFNSEEWKELMAVDPIPVYIVDDPNNPASDQVQNLIDKETPIITPEISDTPIFPGGGFNFDDGSDDKGMIVPATASVNGVDIDPAFANDPSQTGMNFKGNIETIQFFSGRMGLNPAEGAAASTAIHGVIKSALEGVNWADLKSRLMKNLFNVTSTVTNSAGTVFTPFEMSDEDFDKEFAKGDKNKPTPAKDPFDALAKAASKAMQGLKANLKVGEVAVSNLQTYIGNLSNYGARSFVALSKSSSKNMNGLDNNLMTGQVATSDLQSALGNLSNYGARSLLALAKSSSKNMNGFVNNLEKGEEAVNSLQEAIDSLEDKTVTVTVNKRETGGFGGFPGGGFNFAEGGIVSAASGKVTTTVGPTWFLYGDNPGGRETLAFIPHNNPGPTLEKLGQMFGHLDSTIGSMSGNRGSGTVHIHNHFLQREVQQVLNIERGRMISRMA